MKRLVLSSDVTAIDAQTQSLAKIPALSLMESAGLQMYQIWKPLLHVEDKLVFLAGGGNNGGDALVVARYAFNDGFKNIVIVYAGAHLSESSALQRAIIGTYKMSCVEWAQTDDLVRQTIFSNAAWIIDGLVGTGLKGPLKAEIQDLVVLANESPARCLAIDIPSAIGDEVSVSETHIQADLTITMGLEKIGMYHPVNRPSCGKIVLANPSFPPSLLETPEAVALLCERSIGKLPKLKSNEYKNSRGHLAIFGGSTVYTGAARLASRAAFSARAGLVTLFCDPDVYTVAASESPSVMVSVYKHQSLQRFDAILAGPGWGDGREKILRTLFETKKPIVLDADGITCYATILAKGERPEHGPLILTPHLGELRALSKALHPEKQETTIGKNDTPLEFFSSLKQISRELEATLVVKAQLVYIVSRTGELVVVEGNNPSLGVGGSGDVLSGILGALLGKLENLETIALEGTLIHQSAGRLAEEAFGYYDSESLLNCVGAAVKEAEQ